MDDGSQGLRPFGLLTAKHIRAGLRQDMRVLAEAFEQYAPARQLEIHGRQPELASALLRRIARD